MNARCNLAAAPLLEISPLQRKFYVRLSKDPVADQKKIGRKAKIQTGKKSDFKLSKIYQGDMHDVPVSQSRGSSYPPQILPQRLIKQAQK